MRAETRGDMEVASILWGDSWSYDQKAQNYSAEAARYEAMRPNTAPTPVFTAPNTAPKPMSVNPAQTPKSTTPPSAPPGAVTQGELAAGQEKAVWAVPDEGRQESVPAGNETKAWQDYLRRSANQIVMGNYTDDVTLAGTAGQVALGLLGADLPADIRDLTYDLTHLKTTPWYQTALDALALLPVVGGLKYVDEGAALWKQGLNAAEAAGDMTKQVDELVDAGKAAEPLTEAVIAQRKAEILEAIEAQMRKSGVDLADPAQVLDPKALEEYNELREAYANAAQNAAKAGDGEFVTYYRVQTPGDHGSKELISVNQDGTITVDTETFPVKNTSVSAYNTDHATIYAETGKRAGQSYVVAFDVPVWFDEFIRENAILQRGASTSPLNKGGTAPKMTDINTVGFKFEFPSFWNEWLEKYAVNARKIDIGDLS